MLFLPFSLGSFQTMTCGRTFWENLSWHPPPWRSCVWGTAGREKQGWEMLRAWDRINPDRICPHSLQGVNRNVFIFDKVSTFLLERKHFLIWKKKAAGKYFDRYFIAVPTCHSHPTCPLPPSQNSNTSQWPVSCVLNGCSMAGDFSCLPPSSSSSL